MGKKINLEIVFLSVLLMFCGCKSTPPLASEEDDPHFITGIVLQPDGEPAEGAEIAILYVNESLYYPKFPEDVYRDYKKEKLEIYRTDKNGEYNIPIPQKTPCSIACVHESGCREFLYLPYAVNLQKWGTVKGKFCVNSKPIPGETLVLDCRNSFGQIETKTDKKGNFEFKYVPPLPARIYTTSFVKGKASLPKTKYLEVKEGKITNLEIITQRMG